MRTREEMLVNVNGARLVYAWLTNPGNMLIIRLAQDVTDLLETVAEKDAEIEQLRAALSAAKELFEDECTPDERDAYVWLMQTEELLGR